MRLLNKFSDWASKSINRSIFSAALTISGVSVVVKAVSALKEVLIADQYGTGGSLDAFVIAFLIPSLCINVVAVSLTTVAVPAYIQVVAHEGRAAAQRFLSSALLLCIALLTLVCLALAATGPYVLPMLGSNFSPQKIGLTTSLYFILVPVLLFNGVASFLGGILNAGERFGIVVWAQMLVPLATIAALVFFGDRLGIYALAAGTLCGFCFEALMLMVLMKRSGYSLYPRWGGWTPALVQGRSEYLPVTAGAILISGMTAVDQAMAGSLAPGSVAALAYGGRIVGMLLSLMASLGAAGLTYFSKMSAVQDWQGIRHTLRTYSRIVFMLGIPGVVVLIVLSKPIVALFFEHGAFTAQDTEVVSKIQSLYFLQIPFYIAALLIMRLVVSLKANYWVLSISGLGFALNVLLNYLFMRWIGVAGIALSTSIVYIVTFVAFWWVAQRLLRKAESLGTSDRRV